MPVRYGVIGAGAIAQRRHIPECLANPDSTLIAIAPPLIITRDEIDFLFAGIARVLDRLWD